MEITRGYFIEVVMGNFPLKNLLTYKLPKKPKDFIDGPQGRKIRIVHNHHQGSAVPNTAIQ
ncbi:MAG: hypothetical protein TUN42_07680 [Dehalogenimonas sp.]